MDEFISSNPCNFDHAALFEMLQRLTLDHRLNDSYSCLASIFFGLCDINVGHQSDLVKMCAVPLLLVEGVPVYNEVRIWPKRTCILEALCVEATVFPSNSTQLRNLYFLFIVNIKHANEITSISIRPVTTGGHLGLPLPQLWKHPLRN